MRVSLTRCNAKAATLAATLFLGACATTVPPPSPGTTPDASVGRATRASPPPQTVTRSPSRTGFRAPRVMSSRGLEGVIGANARALEQQFGTPRLNVIEGDVRKLQFSGEACVLDVYLYPLTQGAEPTATYVDARRASDGLDVARSSCVAALKR